jgi:hypothetical protein
LFFECTATSKLDTFPETLTIAIFKIAVIIRIHLFHSLCHYRSRILLFFKSSKVLIYLLLSLLVILEIFEPVRLIDEVFELFKLWEFGDAIVEQPPKRERGGGTFEFVTVLVLLGRSSLVRGAIRIAALAHCEVTSSDYRLDQRCILDSKIGYRALLDILQPGLELLLVQLVKAGLAPVPVPCHGAAVPCILLILREPSLQLLLLPNHLVVKVLRCLLPHGKHSLQAFFTPVVRLPRSARSILISISL